MRAGAGPAAQSRWSAFDLAEGFHLAHALTALDHVGVLESLRKPAVARKLATKHRVDRGLLESVLQMLAARTDVIAQRGGKYRLTRRYDSLAHFLFHQYLGAYARNAVELSNILRKPSVAGRLIDRREHAKAFEQTRALIIDILADLTIQLGLNHVLDIGCGTGTMLLDLAVRRTQFVGWGLDVNPWMCRAARKRIVATRTARRIAVFEGDCRNLRAALPPAVIAKVRTITAVSLANEFFANGTSDAVAWLKDLRVICPGRTMLIADYYGRLGKTKKPWQRQIALHDFVQTISGQGVPPANLRAWKKVYVRAGCELIHSVEDRDRSFFIHLLRL